MTIEEKMAHFRELSLENANEQSEEILNSYKQSLDEEFEAHKISAARLAEDNKKARMNQVRYAAKKELVSAQMQLKNEVVKKQAEVKSKVFHLVKEKIQQFRKTPEYISLLTSQIKDVMQEYHDSDMTIYIDPDDAALLEDLKQATGMTNILIYKQPFYGGTRTIVPSRNILVDNSFKTRIADEKEQFIITL